MVPFPWGGGSSALVCPSSLGGKCELPALSLCISSGLVQALCAGVRGDSGFRFLVPSSPAGIDFPDAVHVYTGVCVLRVHPVWGVCVYLCVRSCACVHVGRKPRLAWRLCLPHRPRLARCLEPWLCVLLGAVSQQVLPPGPTLARSAEQGLGQSSSLCGASCCQGGVGDSQPALGDPEVVEPGDGQGPGQGRRAESAPREASSPIALPAAPAARAVLSLLCIQGSRRGVTSPVCTASKWQSRIGAGCGACVWAAPQGPGVEAVGAQRVAGPRLPDPTCPAWAPSPWPGTVCAHPGFPVPTASH